MILRSLFLLAMVFIINPVFAQKLKTITKFYAGNTTIKTEYTVLKKKKYIKHGTYKNYFKSGKVKLSGDYDQNRRTGEWKEFDVHGNLHRVKIYRLGKLILDKKHGLWKEETSVGKYQFFDYDKNERVFPQIPLLVKYPTSARESKISGIVKVKASFDENCEETTLTVVKSLGKDFDKEALNGVTQYLEKLKLFEYDCPGFNQIFTLTFDGSDLP